MDQLAELKQRYTDACHAMQSGVKMTIEVENLHTLDPDHRGHSPKHLRTGVNSALVDCSALAKLLMGKGLISELEYYAAITIAMEEEVARYEQELSSHFHKRITLG